MTAARPALIALMLTLAGMLGTLPALAPPAEAQTAGRRISGALIYRARIALPRDSRIVVTLSTPDGTRIAQMSAPTKGAQIPLPFALVGPAHAPLVLRGAVFAKGRLLMASAPIPLRAGSKALITAPVLMSRLDAAAFAIPLICGGQSARITYIGSGARLVAGQRYDLVPDPTDPAKLVAKGDPGVWAKPGDPLTLHLGGKDLPPCTPDLPPMLFPLKAGGHEPGWQVELAFGRLLYTPQEGAKIAAPLPLPENTEAGLRFALPAEKLTLVLKEALCHDTATGLPHPYTARLTLDGKTRTGCGGQPMALLERGQPWQVISAGSDDLKTAGAEIRFLANQASGRTGCNRFSARLFVSEGLRFGPIATTKMACPGPKMQAEQALLNALAATDGFDLVDGELHLLARGKVVLTAR